MTGPLANEFAQVREAVEDALGADFDAGRENAKSVYEARVAALARIEEHTHNTEKALERIIEYRRCIRFDITPCDERAELEEVEWCPVCVYRAALSAGGRNTSMNGRLAQIEARATPPYDFSTQTWPSWSRDVLALVEIAKAARETLADHTLPERDSPNRRRLRAALSVLDDREET